MERSVTFYKETIPYSVRESKRAKYVRLTVYFDGSVVATKPAGVSERRIKRFIKQKAEWVLKKLERVRYSQPDIARTDDEHFYFHKQRAYEVVKEKVEYWNTYLGFSYNTIYIRRQKTRWGSCSSKRNLSLNYKIVFLPEQLQDYIIVHELCHLKEMNHSNSFWNLMEAILPESRELNKKLKRLSSPDVWL